MDVFPPPPTLCNSLPLLDRLTTCHVAMCGMASAAAGPANAGRRARAAGLKA